MRVALISGEYPPMRGGVADYTALLAAGLTRFGVEVTVLTSTRAAGTFVTTSPQVFPWVESWGSRLWMRVHDHVERFDPDVIHVQYQTGAFEMRLGVNLLPWLNRLGRHRPRFVVTFHDLKEPYILPKIGRLRHLATHVLAAGADAVVATNSEDFVRLGGTKGDQRTGASWGRRPLRAIPIGSNIPARLPDGFDRQVWRSKLGVRDGETLIAYFGFLNPSKGLDTLITAFETLVHEGHPVRLLMIGASSGDTGNSDRRYEKHVRQRLDQPWVRGHVGWTGFVQADEVAAHLRASDVCVLPFRDGVSLRHGTLIAAIVHHLPIVTTIRESAQEFGAFPELRDEENALLVPPEDARALGAAITRIVTDVELRQRVSDGIARLAENFRWDSIANRTLRLYQEICRGAERPRLL